MQNCQISQQRFTLEKVNKLAGHFRNDFKLRLQYAYKTDSMELIKGISSLSHRIAHPIVTIGNFDGVHLGHQHIIQLAIEKATPRRGHCVAYTFRPHPQVALKPETQLQLLSTYEERAELMGQMGVDYLIEEPFSREFSTTEPKQFFTDIILRQLNAEAIVVGYDFAFGKGRQGHLDALSSLCKHAGVELTIVQPQRVDGEIVSSSKIRQHLANGDVDIAQKLLGRPFSYHGVVIKGEGRGKKLGFPTANLKIENKLTLPFGVYATLSKSGNKTYSSITNIGVRPTFHSEDGKPPVLVETFLLDTSLDLYGSTLEVQFVKRLREEKKFSGIDQLKAQIGLDIDQRRKI